MAVTKRTANKTPEASAAAEKLNAARAAWEKEKAADNLPQKETDPGHASHQMPWAIPVPVMMEPENHGHQYHHAHGSEQHGPAPGAPPEIPLPPQVPQTGTLVESIQKLVQMGISFATTAISGSMQMMQGMYGMPHHTNYDQHHQPYHHGQHDSCGCGYDYRHDCGCDCDYDGCCNPSVHGCCR